MMRIKEVYCMNSYQYIRFFSELGLNDVPLVGGKNASLGEMYRQLNPMGVKVPNGFAITAEAYTYILRSAQIEQPLRELFDDLDPDDVRDLARTGKQARDLIYGAALPDDLKYEIIQAAQCLYEEYGDGLSLAVRSSATAEDLPTASFAGQQESFLNISGDLQLLDSCKRCFASLFTDRAIHYRIDQGFDHFQVALSIGVMKMVRSDLASSGVMFSLDTESGFKDVVFITGAYGLGENVVQGTVDPDEFYVFKPTFRQGHKHVLRRNLGSKQIKMIYSHGGTRQTTRNIPTDKSERQYFCISDEEVSTLADYAIKVEDYYSAHAGVPRPMDMEWAKDGLDGELYLVQARPETVISQQSATEMEDYRLTGAGEIVAHGRAVGSKIASGNVKVISNVAHLPDFKPGEVLVADTTTPDWEPVMKTAAAIVTNRGGRTCHAAIIARELGIPAVVGVENATSVLKGEQQVTVSCAEGETGHIYRGGVPFEVEKTDLSHLSRPQTHIMLILGNPDLAFKHSFLPNDGIGLARMEFIINEYIMVHPMALLHPEKVTDPGQLQHIQKLTAAYSTPAEYFIGRLAEGIGTLAAAFYPKPVILRMSDFKTNEYASLIGGAAFESEEENPMLGFRGASRYTHPAYEEGFALECAAVKRVRTDMGLTNLKIMIPFCRRVDEAKRVIAKLESLGLNQGDDGLEVFVMCEIPNNVVQIDQFAKVFDGFSIGSNDLTQLVLGVDRDSQIVSFDFDERDEGVKTVIRWAVEGAKRNGRHVGFCGQAPSDYPEMAEFLVELGIDSISLQPDTLMRTTQLILELEQRLGRSPRE